MNTILKFMLYIYDLVFTSTKSFIFWAKLTKVAGCKNWNWLCEIKKLIIDFLCNRASSIPVLKIDKGNRLILLFFLNLVLYSDQNLVRSSLEKITVCPVSSVWSLTTYLHWYSRTQHLWGPILFSTHT